MRPVLAGQETFTFLRCGDLIGEKLIEFVEAAAIAHGALDEDRHGPDDKGQLFLYDPQYPPVEMVGGLWSRTSRGRVYITHFLRVTTEQCMNSGIEAVRKTNSDDRPESSNFQAIPNLHRYGEDPMKATRLLHDLGQSLWLDNITRDLLGSGTLKRYIDELSVTGLTSNPTIFDHAIKNSAAYDDAIRRQAGRGVTHEALFFELALEDITRAADLFLPVHEKTNGVDGWVSLEVSPVLAYDTARTISAARELHARAARPNVLIKIPGTREGLPAIEEAIFAGVPVNVTLLFSREHYVAAAEAYLRGIERRIEAGLNPAVGSVASLFVSRWDAAVTDTSPESLRAMLGIAIAGRTYTAYNELLGSARWLRAYNAGARPQRLLWASTGTKDPHASDILYIKALAAPFTVNTMPDGTLKALADHGELGDILSADGGDAEEILAQFGKAGIDVDALAARLQEEGAASFVKSWNELLEVIASRRAALEKAG